LGLPASLPNCSVWCQYFEENASNLGKSTGFVEYKACLPALGSTQTERSVGLIFLLHYGLFLRPICPALVALSALFPPNFRSIFTQPAPNQTVIPLKAHGRGSDGPPKHGKIATW
jgi:hypothetical protein